MEPMRSKPGRWSSASTDPKVNCFRKRALGRERRDVCRASADERELAKGTNTQGKGKRHTGPNTKFSTSNLTKKA